MKNHSISIFSFVLVTLLLISSPVFIHAQIGIGVKAGLNFANVTNTSSFNNESRTGYMIGGYIAPKPKKLFGFRSEIMISRQGYDFKTNSNTGTVDLDYLLLPQLITLNITKRFEIHAGGQIAFLLNAKADSTNSNNNGSIMNYFSRFDYGIVGGVQVAPISGLFVGARINIGLKDINDDSWQLPGNGPPNFFPREFVKNNVVQLYAGWRF